MDDPNSKDHLADAAILGADSLLHRPEGTTGEDIRATYGGTFITGITAAGGWCAPTEAIYDAAALDHNEYTMLSGLMPEFRVLRPGTPEWEENQRKQAEQREIERMYQGHVQRVIGDVARAQDWAMFSAYKAAEAAGMDLNITQPPHGHTMWRWNLSGDLAAYRFIGLELVERSTETWRVLQGDRAIIIREQTRGYYDDWDD